MAFGNLFPLLVLSLLQFTLLHAATYENLVSVDGEDLQYIFWSRNSTKAGCDDCQTIPAANSANGLGNYLPDFADLEARGVLQVSNGQTVVRPTRDGLNQSQPATPSSLRLVSNYNITRGVIKARISYWGQGTCGVTSTLMTTGSRWPEDGGIKLVQTVNNNTTSLISVHTSDGCMLRNVADPTMKEESDCSDLKTNNQGCSVIDPQPLRSTSIRNGSVADDFIAVERAENYIAIWHFSAGRDPQDKNNQSLWAIPPEVDTTSWGAPVANFTGSCNLNDHFAGQVMVFDVSYCDDFARATWESSGCQAQTQMSCHDYIMSRPDDLKNNVGFGTKGIDFYDNEQVDEIDTDDEGEIDGGM